MQYLLKYINFKSEQVQGVKFIAVSRAEVTTGPLNFQNSIPLLAIDPHPAFQPKVGNFLHNLLVATTTRDIVYSPSVLPVRLLSPELAVSDQGLEQFSLGKVISDSEFIEIKPVYLTVGVETSQVAKKIGDSSVFCVH